MPNQMLLYDFEKDELTIMPITNSNSIRFYNDSEIMCLTIPDKQVFYVMRISATSISDFDFKFVEKTQGENIIDKYIRDYLCTSDEIINKTSYYNLGTFSVIEKETILLDANLCSFSLYQFIINVK
jgi:hypothetical protein